MGASTARFDRVDQQPCRMGCRQWSSSRGVAGPKGSTDDRKAVERVGSRLMWWDLERGSRLRDHLWSGGVEDLSENDLGVASGGEEGKGEGQRSARLHGDW